MNFLCLIGLHKWRKLLLVIRPRSKFEKVVYRVHVDRCIREDCGITTTYIKGKEGIPPPGHSIFKETAEKLKNLGFI